MPDELAEAFNHQIAMEFSSSMAYLQLSADLESKNFIGMANWMRMQAEEERNHAYRFFQFVLDRGNQVEIGAIEAPGGHVDTPEEAFAAALAHEQAVTAAIHDLYRSAASTGDLASFPLLQTFIDEQNEEESTVETILERVRLAAGETSALLLLDSELGLRTTTP